MNGHTITNDRREAPAAKNARRTNVMAPWLPACVCVVGSFFFISLSCLSRVRRNFFSSQRCKEIEENDEETHT